MTKRGLYANINRRKKLGISRPKSKSTITKKAPKGAFFLPNLLSGNP